jgi:hypothetical protein
VRFNPYLLLAFAVAAFGTGFFLFGHGLILATEDLLFGLWEWFLRTFSPSAIRLREMAQESRSPRIMQTGVRGTLTSTILLPVLRYPFPILVAVVLAIWIQDWLLSPIMILVGAVISAALFTRLSRRYYNQITDELEMLILQFVSRYPLRNSVATALSESADQLPKGVLHDAASNTATRLKLQDGSNPYRDLLAIPHPVARRFAGVLMRAGFASPEVFLDLLGQLRKDTESRRELSQRVRRDLTLESATITILQVVLIISLVAAALLPAWRDYYTGSVSNRVIYLALVLTGVVGTVIGENEVRFLEES